MMDFLADNMKVRISGDERKRIAQIIRTKTLEGNLPKYESISHFIRCAVQRLLSEEENG